MAEAMEAMETDPQLTHELSAELMTELSRVYRYIRFGTETSAVDSCRHLSVNSLVRMDADRHRLEVPKKKLSLKSVENVWKRFADADNSDDNQRLAKSVCERIQQMVDEYGRQSGQQYAHRLPLLMVSLFACQKSATVQSPFRALAVSLFDQQYVHPLDVLLFAAMIGFKRLNSNNQLRHCFRLYYRRPVTDKDIELNLTFGRKFEWSQRDIIRLCHPKITPMTEALMKYKNKKFAVRKDGDRKRKSAPDTKADPTTPTSDSVQTSPKRFKCESGGAGDTAPEPSAPTDGPNVAAIETRIQAFRSAKATKVYDIMPALDATLLDPSDWFQALNTVWSNEPLVWHKLIGRLAHVADGDSLLRLVPVVFSRFPNNDRLFRELVTALRRNGHKCSANFVKHLVLFYCEKNVLNLTTQLLPELAKDVLKLSIPYRLDEPILIVFDKGLDLKEKYLSNLSDKHRLKQDLMESMAVNDFVWILLQSFRCFASIDGRIESLQFVDTNANTVERFDQLVSRFDGLSDE
ncbi:unnamed protein product, partial [Medioppia subpectinata]